MATGEKQTVGARVEEDIVDGLEAVESQEGYEDRSDAVRDVLRTGIREKRGPVAQNWRDIAHSAAYHLTLVAVLLVVVGFGTSMLTPARATALALVTITVAIAPIAALELWRLVSGQAALDEGGDAT